MTTFWYYRDPSGAWNLDLGSQAIRLGSNWSLTEAAVHGDVGTGGVEIDDPLGTAGYLSDGLVGLKTFAAWEGSAPVNNRFMFTGYIGDRHYSRGTDSLRLGVASRITVDLQDMNAAASFLVITSGGKRPSETVSARLTWLLGSGFLNVGDNGLVVYPTTVLDAADYTGQTCDFVLNDCSLSDLFNWFLYWYEPGGLGSSLAFFNANTSTLYSSTTRISNVLADVDSDPVNGAGATNTWAPALDATLDRSPALVGSGVWYPYSSGNVYKTRAATITAFAKRDRTAADSNTKTAAVATTRANQFLVEHSTENDALSWTTLFSAANVNDIRAGQRIQVKFSHLRGYTSYTWVRIVRRTLMSAGETPDVYALKFEATPQETFATPDCNVDLNRSIGTVTADTARGTGQQWQRPTDANDGNNATFAQLDNGFGDFVAYLKADLGSAKTVSSFAIVNRGDFSTMSNGGSGRGDLQYSTDNVTWVSLTWTFSGAYNDLGTGAIFTFTAPIAARYWAIKANNGGVYSGRVDVETWKITGCP